jgi:hypothetical protein
MPIKPSASELLAAPSVIASLRQALVESFVGTDRSIEQGGFIVRDTKSGALSIERLPAGRQNALAFPICANGMYNGREIAGSFHTHPNTGVDWIQEPSPQDIRLSQDYPETMGPHQFVVSQMMIYCIAEDGIVSELGSTACLLGLGETEN